MQVGLYLGEEGAVAALNLPFNESTHTNYSAEDADLLFLKDTAISDDC